MSKQQISSLDAVKKILSGGSMPGEKAKGGDQRRYKFPATTDEVRIRVLPQKDDPSFPMKISIYHYDMPGISKGNDRQREQKKTDDGKERGASVKCLQMFNLECPICKVLKNYEGRAELEDWAARVSGIANVLVKNDPTQKIDARLPHIAYFSIGVIKWFENLYKSEDGPALVNINNGYDVIVHRKKYNGAFELRTGLQSSPLADTKEKIKDIMANAYNLSDIIGKADDNLITRAKEAARFLEAEIESVIAAKGELAAGTGDDDAGVDNFDPDEQIGEPSEENTEVEEEGTAIEGEEQEEEQEQEEAPAPAASKKTAPKTQAKAPPSNAKPAAAAKTAPKTEAKGKAKETAPAKAAPKSKISRPAGAPECYANAKEHDPDSEKCLECPHEFHCETAISAAKH